MSTYAYTTPAGGGTLVICDQCGATVLTEEGADRLQQHADWHFVNRHRAVPAP